MKLIDKKKGIKAIERITGKRSEYMGPPTFAYVIGQYTVDRDGNVTGDDVDDLERRLANDGIASEGVELQDGKLVITGFPDTVVYHTLAEVMIRAASTSKWISPDETIEENEKFYMRAWLVRIGLGGPESKDIRNILLKNLKGHTAFRTEESRERWEEKRHESK